MIFNEITERISMNEKQFKFEMKGILLEMRPLFTELKEMMNALPHSTITPQGSLIVSYLNDDTISIEHEHDFEITIRDDKYFIQYFNKEWKGFVAKRPDCKTTFIQILDEQYYDYFEFDISQINVFKELVNATRAIYNELKN